MLRHHCALFFAVLVAPLACAGCLEPLQINLDVHSSGQAEISAAVMGPFLTEANAPPPTGPGSVNSWGGVDWRSTGGIRWVGMNGRVRDIRGLDLGGIRVATWEKQPDGNQLLVLRIDVKPESPFLAKLDLSAEKLARLEQLFLFNEGEVKAPDAPKELEGVKFTVRVPGKVTESQATAGTSSLPTHKNDQKAELELNLKRLLAGAYGGIEWKIVCGPETEDGRRASRRFTAAAALREAGVETIGVGLGPAGDAAGKTLVLRDAGEWTAFLAAHRAEIAGIAPWEPIDFARQSVVISYGRPMGRARHAFAVLDELEKGAETWVLRVAEREALKDYPEGHAAYHIARIPRPDRPLEVHRDRVAW